MQRVVVITRVAGMGVAPKEVWLCARPGWAGL